MSQPTPTETSPVRDFTRKRERLLFRIDDDVFEAATALPGKTLARFAARFANVENIPVEQQLDAFTDALGMVLLDESNARFQKRLDDLSNPIELEQASDVIQWLLEAYGLRPTEPSSPSSTGLPSPASGTSSTDAQQPQVSIPATFLPTAS
ncbi:hypothetical protein [Streptomyces sp. A012304]|uniref:hypothetical protein n=1 Tax=Streptomyces sp. A012304 TaxID=375446 RepID=UPI002231F02E|nr:hypothetical protein [Streptomyces sp. A012304]GKQ35199.1 hypothetical protein ALMP_17450 [Streptomyces sp. A012304]